jgi:hypothetical protein
MQTMFSSETIVTTWCHSPENYNRNVHGCDSLRSKKNSIGDITNAYKHLILKPARGGHLEEVDGNLGQY